VCEQAWRAIGVVTTGVYPIHRLRNLAARGARKVLPEPEPGIPNKLKLFLTRTTKAGSIPTIRDRVVQRALKPILEPIFEADFQSGSYGYRPKRSAHEAVARVAQAIAHQKTRVLDFDLRAFFDNVRHHI